MGAVHQKLQQILVKVKKLKDYYVPDFKINVIEVDVDFIAKRLEKLPNWSWDKWLPLDGKYYTVTLEDFKKIIAWDRTNRHKYIKDRFDCDKYAMYFKANVAWVFGVNAIADVLDYNAGHSYDLIFPYDVSEALIYEPQTDSIIKIENRDTRFYRLGNNYKVEI